MSHNAESSPVLRPESRANQNLNSLDIKRKIADKTIAVFGLAHVNAMLALIGRESGFRPGAVNKSSGACGLPQALPCAKMGCTLEDVDCQVSWLTTYVADRYGDPKAAWQHEVNFNWY